ncbi:S-methyl-5-thioribose-1-phosphate isomerase [Granulosicoccaceae sp. 1_MG-2023]|nr:S-methyl-5-thioribose-1-phosphate isomerase [Granulosicoccaceae sp. 1_MG-2023]
MTGGALTGTLPATVRWEDGRLYLLDQTLLPAQTRIEEQQDLQQLHDSIRRLAVRGAPAIGVAAAWGLCLAVRDKQALPREALLAALREAGAYLISARPTAVNLAWAVGRMLELAGALPATLDAAGIYSALCAEARAIQDEDVALCAAMGEHGAPLIGDNTGVLTHCNAGAMATAGIGTATAPMYVAHGRGVKFRVYTDETRPLLQGARITAWELQQAGIPTTLITDNMAAHLMSQGLIDLVITGTDRVAANGDVANKIGTLGVAILARHFGIPFYVACPSSTIDLATATGAEIRIEERGAEEVTTFGGVRVAPPDIETRNPAFDVTPAELVSGLITERGIVRQPYTDNLARLFA